jgi:phage gp36-like protein
MDALDTAITVDDLASWGLPLAALEDYEAEAPGSSQMQIAGAVALARTYLDQRLTPPYTVVGAATRMRVAQLAAYLLVRSRGFDPTRSGHEDLRLAHDDAVSWLEGVAAGKVRADVTDSAAPLETVYDFAGGCFSSDGVRNWGTTAGVP